MSRLAHPGGLLVLALASALGCRIGFNEPDDVPGVVVLGVPGTLAKGPIGIAASDTGDAAALLWAELFPGESGHQLRFATVTRSGRLATGPITIDQLDSDLDIVQGWAEGDQFRFFYQSSSSSEYRVATISSGGDVLERVTISGSWSDASFTPRPQGGWFMVYVDVSPTPDLLGFREYDSDGQMIGAPLEPIEDLGLSLGAREPTIARADDGTIAVSFREDSTARWLRLDATGLPIADSVETFSSTSGQDDPVVRYDGGAFVIAAQHTSSDDEVIWQRFNVDGSASWSSFAIVATGNDQESMDFDLAADSAGNLAAVVEFDETTVYPRLDLVRALAATQPSNSPTVTTLDDGGVSRAEEPVVVGLDDAWMVAYLVSREGRRVAIEVVEP